MSDVKIGAEILLGDYAGFCVNRSMALVCANAAPLLETFMKKERKTARQILSESPREVISVGPADAVLTALRLMADEDVTTVLVLQSSNLVGILSRRDYARKVELAGRSAAETKVGEIMTTQVFYVTPEYTCEQCLALMHTRRIRHLPVIDSGQVIGVLSSSDILEELIQEDEHFISILEHDMVYLTMDTGGAY